MKVFLRRKPSASMVVAIIALVVAASGTAVAATKLVNGNKLIKKHTLSGNRLQNKTITGTQVNLKKLGTVPKATTATSAGSATTATTATNALALGGQAPGAFAQASSIGRSGTVVLAPGQNKTLFQTGNLVLAVSCAAGAGGSTDANVYLGSTASSWVYLGTNETTSPVQIDQVNDSGSVGQYSGDWESVQALTTTSQMEGEYLVGVNWPAAGDCYFDASSLQ